MDNNQSLLFYRAQNGDKEAYNAIVRICQDLGVGYAYSILKDFQLAEDAAQETFIEAYRQLIKLYHPSAFPAWLRKIVFKHCDRIRRVRSEDVVLPESRIHTSSDTPGPDAYTEMRELQRQVNQVIQTLPERERLAVVLFYIGDYRMREISRFLGVPVQTVKSRLHTARRKLKERMVPMVKDHLHRQAPSKTDAFAQRVANLVQPYAMRTERYLCGLTPLNGHDAWTIMRACIAGDADTVETMLHKDPELANTDFWYEYPLSLAVRGGHTDIVRRLLKAGADPGRCRWAVTTWDTLLERAEERGDKGSYTLLETEMKKRFRYNPNFSVLTQAIFSRQQPEIEKVMNQHPDLARTADVMGNTAIHWCVLTRQPGLISCFLESGVDIDARRMDGRTAVDVAVDFTPGDGHGYWFHPHGYDLPEDIVHNRWFIAGYLIALGAEYTLSTAAAVGDASRARDILNQTPEVVLRLDPAHRSPLSCAAREGHDSIIKIFLDHGADPNRPEMNAPRGAALFLASANNHVAVAELLLRAGADPNADYDSSGCCFDIVRHKHPESYQTMQDLLRRYGARVPDWGMDVDDFKAALKQNPERLCEPWFLSSMLSHEDETLLDMALKIEPEFPRHLITGVNPVLSKTTSMVRKLLDHGLDPNAPGWLGKTFLHVCAERNDVENAEILLNAGADINVPAFETAGTPLATAARYGHLDMVKCLLDRGADPDIADGPWATPLARAVKAGYNEITGLLKQHGGTHTVAL